MPFVVATMATTATMARPCHWSSATGTLARSLHLESESPVFKTVIVSRSLTIKNQGNDDFMRWSWGMSWDISFNYIQLTISNIAQISNLCVKVVDLTTTSGRLIQLCNPTAGSRVPRLQCHQARFQSLAGFQDSTVAGFQDCKVADFWEFQVSSPDLRFQASRFQTC